MFKPCKEYYKQAKDNKAVHQVSAQDYLQVARSGVGLSSIDPNKLICALCGKSFKTEGGYKYHIQNVCIAELDPGNAEQELHPTEPMPPLNR